MPARATKRGSERTRLQRDCDVLVCGASFAGLAVARELAGSGAQVLVVDRYEIGERQTSACAMPTEWLAVLEQKTRGNLDEQEAQVVESLLADLRMQYVSFSGAPTPPPAKFSASDITGGK